MAARTVTVVVLVLVLGATGMPTAASASPSSPVELVVVYRAGADPHGAARRLAGGADRVATVLPKLLDHRGMAVAQLTVPGSAVHSLLADPHVVEVAPNDEYGVASAVVEQRSPAWHLDRIDQRDRPLDGRHRFLPDGGTGVRIYVVDSGLRADHAEFGGRVEPGVSLVVDDVGVDDCVGHGTQVASVAAGATLGVARAARIVPVRVLDCAGRAALVDLLGAMDWILATHPAGSPGVVNLSLGGPVNRVLDLAVQRLVVSGLTVVTAAGNLGEDACATSPGRVPEAINVSAVDAADRRSGFANHGPCVDLFAPGDRMVTAWPWSRTATTVDAGTSFAAPMVAGAAALLLGQRPALAPAQVQQSIRSMATPNRVADPAGSPNRLLAIVTAGPLPPTRVAATARTSAATVSWSPGPDGGSAITGWTVEVLLDGRRVATQPVGGSASRLVVQGLEAGRRYSFRVVARNRFGVSAPSMPSGVVVPLADTQVQGAVVVK